MKTSCSSWSFHRTIRAGEMDQMSHLRTCAELDLDGVELLSNHFPAVGRDYLARLRKACSDLHLTVAMVSAGGNLAVADDKQRAAQVGQISGWLETGAFLGAPCVRIFSPRQEDLDAGGAELYKKVIGAFKRVATLGAERGITLAMENHGGSTAQQMLRLLADVDSPFLRFALDVGNFPPVSQVGPDTYPSIERCAPHAAIVHAKFFNVEADGSDRDFDWHRIRGILAAAGFRGFLSIEYEGEDDDEMGVVTRIARFIKTLR